MMCISVRSAGIILFLIGVGLIGFFDVGYDVLGPISFPFVENIRWLFGFAGLGFTSVWWNTKLWGLVIGIAGLALLKYG